MIPVGSYVMTIEDGNSLFYYMKELPLTFKEICEKKRTVYQHNKKRYDSIQLSGVSVTSNSD